MLRKPAKDHPLPAFDRDDDESASTGEFRPLVHDVRALPSFSADDLPRFPSMVDPRERESGPTITKKAEPLPRFASMVDPHELERERVPASRGPAPARAPTSTRRADALPRFSDADVAATLEKRPMTANAANRILAQLDRAPPRLDSTGEIEIEDVLEEVYAEPAPRSKRSDAPPASRGFAAESAPRRAQSSQSSRPAPMPSSVASRAPESVAPRPFVPAPPPSFTGTAAPQATRQNPPSFAPPLPAAAVSPSSPPAYPSSPVASFAPPAPPPYLAPLRSAYAPSQHAPSQHAPSQQQQSLAYAATVPAYVPGPQGSLMVPSSQAFAIGTTHNGSFVRPLPTAVTVEPRDSGILGKVLAGGLILGLSALAGGAVSLWFVPEKAPAAVPSVTVPSVAVPPPGVPTASAPVAPAPSAVVPSASGVQTSPSVMAPVGNGWPLAPATVPPGAASMAPPPPAEKAVEPPPASTGKLAEGMGRIVFAPSRMGHRVWIDGAMVGEPTGPLVVKCGKRNIRIGSGANGQSVDVPCGGEVVVK